MHKFLLLIVFAFVVCAASVCLGALVLAALGYDAHYIDGTLLQPLQWVFSGLVISLAAWLVAWVNRPSGPYIKK
ncbi:MAG: hypothetical protein Unbinned4162contig1001_43 [Prokaryotic dsDNA virus sp.]|nr:MAG: hypothetical protein Unbinned4162contig1001_43 [Prokaryotic dsDNA virus sp.]|tara:strand:- start:4025 stop:4246 length:222 start_codon:yes stop_codon:yes gene_type:complete